MRLFIRRMMNLIVCRAVVSVLGLLALLANNADSQENESLKLNNANECHPNGSSGSSSSSSSSSLAPASDSSSATTTCENGYHCVFNGHSSIGGYCINNDHKSDSTQMDMDMPAGLQSICFICNDDDHFDFDLNQSSSMSKPNDKVGVFTCEELDQHGKSGSIPQANCDIFQRMIHNNNLCGCNSSSGSSTATEGKYTFDDDFIEDIQVLDDHVNTYSSRTGNGNGNGNDNDEDDEVQSLTTTTSSSDSFSKRTSAAAATTTTTIIVATLSILQSFLSSF